MFERGGTGALFERYYFGRKGFVNGTTEFHEMCRQHLVGNRLLEIGAGPPNRTTEFLATLGRVTGADVSPEVRSNSALAEAIVYDGATLPFANASFDGCVSNYVLEHVANPERHFAEVARVLRPGGAYVVRTPNLFHYVALASSLIPHSGHVWLAKALRRQTTEDHDPWVTYYRANTPGKIRRLADQHGLRVSQLRLVEKEPSYGRASALLFYPMMAYERVVNATQSLSALRSGIVGVLLKDAAPD